MKRWERRALGLLAAGGGFLGVVLGVSLLVSPGNLLAKLLLLPFIALYAWGVRCGVLMLESDPRAVRSSIWFWALQTPYFMSPVFGYFFASGSLLYVTYSPAETSLGALYRLGSQFEYSLLQADKPLVVGINLFAVAVLCLLVFRLREAPSNNSSKPTPLRGAA